ncbi:MAG: hypothetical protein GAK30_01574 [Paracidovorax wautersii]|uniref:Lysophospholipase L1 n=1 Tax=Paracidovorax wautersii TaxID=1177982 RepID=A0A7V8FPS2_9BURK|nr:MAG: hypothetical protein GAK30_01574 [Paracidovorax wautersii]
MKTAVELDRWIDGRQVEQLQAALPTIDSVEDIAFGVVDKDGRRTWLESDKAGRPTERATDLIATAVDIKGRAATAVQDAGLAPGPPAAESLAFAVVDAENRRTWLEAGKDGRPTARAASLIAEAVDIDGAAAAAVDTAGLGNGDGEASGLAFAVCDKDGRRTWLEAGLDGKPTLRAASLLGSMLNLPSEVPAQYRSTYAATAVKIACGPDIICWGDSMTAGAGGNGTTYPNVLQSLLAAAGSSATVRNAGVGGESSVTITARSGANPFILLPTTGEIPASGGVTVSLEAINGYAPAPLFQGTGTPGTSFSGYLAGVLGTLSRSETDGVSTYTFTRSTAGAAVSVARPQPFRTLFSEARREDIQIIWIGQNGPGNARAIQDARAIINHCKALDKRYLVISKPGGTSAADVDDAAFFAEFGRRFIPIRQYMVRFGLADAGIEPTEGDLTDIAAGTVPRSIRVDSVHWIAAGYTILGNLIYQRLNELGWV